MTCAQLAAERLTGTVIWKCHGTHGDHLENHVGKPRGTRVGSPRWETSGEVEERNRGGRAASVEGVAVTRRSQRGRKRSQRVVKEPKMTRTEVSKKATLKNKVAWKSHMGTWVATSRRTDAQKSQIGCNEVATRCGRQLWHLQRTKFSMGHCQLHSW